MTSPLLPRWSRTSRLFPCEEQLGAWLPVEDMTRAICATGYSPSSTTDRCGTHEAWWSLEVFNTSLADPDPSCVQHHGERGIRGLRTLWDRVRGPPVPAVEAEAGSVEVAPPAKLDGFSPSSSDSDSSPGTSRSNSTKTSIPISEEAKAPPPVMADSRSKWGSMSMKATDIRNNWEVRKRLADGCIVA